MLSKQYFPILLIISLCLISPAFAHSGGEVSDGFVSGLTHPIFGWDHVVAMVAVGLWGAVLGKPATWILPIVFPVVMSFGAALGILAVPIPYVEAGIALSGVILGILIAFLIKTPMIFAAFIVGLFGIFHGYAHGTELPHAANPISYAVGFVISTGLLHLAGIVFGTLIGSNMGKMTVRVGGGLIALVGMAFLTGIA